MTPGEVVGLSLTVAMLAFLTGVLAVASRDRSESAHQDDHELRRTRLAKYLGARRAVTRASLMFVASFRALASAKETSPHRRLRIKEASASRRRLHNALDDLDKAQADLIVWFPEFTHTGEGGRGVDVATLRKAIDGTDEDTAKLAERLRDTDRSAVARVRDLAKTLQETPQASIGNDLSKAIIVTLERFRR